jgi:carbon storage regulator
MLVLSRKSGESVKVSDNIEVFVLSVDGGRVRLGIKAPQNVRIVRTELEETVASANSAAAVKGTRRSLVADASQHKKIDS